MSDIWRRFREVGLFWRVLAVLFAWPVVLVVWFGSKRRRGGSALLVFALILELCWVAALAGAYTEGARSARSVATPTASARAQATPRPLATPRASGSSPGPDVLPAATQALQSETPGVGPGDLTLGLRVELEHRGGYDRDFFGDWTDADGDGCNTRREVLIAESRSPVVVGPNCSLIGGRWYSEYDGVETTDPSTFDVDHMVPLAEAWSSGAWNWSADRRRRFANDLDFEGSLIAVTASSNRSKSDQDPADWIPPRRAYECAYASTWLEVKRRWDLSIDTREKAALDAILTRC